MEFIIQNKMNKKYFFILCMIQILRPAISRRYETPFYESLQVVEDYFDFEKEYEKAANTNDMVDLNKIRMQIDPQHFESPSRSRLPRINALTKKYSEEFREFRQNQADDGDIGVDIYPLNDSERHSSHSANSEGDFSASENITPEGYDGYLSNLNQIRTNGYYLKQVLENDELMTLEDMVVVHNVMKKFKKQLMEKQDDLNDDGEDIDGTDFVFDIDQDELYRFNLRPGFIQIPGPKKKIKKNPGSENESSQGRSSYAIPTEVSTLQDKWDSLDSTDLRGSLEEIPPTPAVTTFAAKRFIFYINKKTVREDELGPVEETNDAMSRELEALAVARVMDPSHLFYVRNFGNLEIFKFLKKLNLKPPLDELQDNAIYISDQKSLPGNVGFSVMSANAFDLEFLLVNLSLNKTLFPYYIFLQMIINLANGLIILQNQFYHCNLTPKNIMFRKMDKAQAELYDQEIVWLKTVDKDKYDLLRIDPNEVDKKLDGKSIMAYPMELFPGEHYLVSINGLGKDFWMKDECQPQTKFYRTCTEVDPKYAPFEYGVEISNSSGFDGFSLAMMFTQVLLAEVGFKGFGAWNTTFTFMKLAGGSWTFFSGTNYSKKNKNVDKSSDQRNRFDYKDKFEQETQIYLKDDQLYLHMKQKWDSPGLSSKKEILAKLDKVVISLGEYSSLYEVFSISESNQTDDSVLQNLDFDSFLFLNRSQFRYLWLVFLRYFWDELYTDLYNEKLQETFDVESIPDLLEVNKSSLSSSVEVNPKRPSLTDDTDDEVLEYFVDQVLKMKREVLPFKKHMGLVLFEMLYEVDSSKRKSLEDLRDFAEGQYYSLLSQAKHTFGLELKTDSNVTPHTDDQEETNLESLQMNNSKVEMREYFGFSFDLDSIVEIRRTKHVVSIQEGKAVVHDSKFDDNTLDSGAMVRRGTVEYTEENEQLFGDTNKIKNFLKENNIIKKIFKNFKISKCFKRVKQKEKKIKDRSEQSDWDWIPSTSPNVGYVDSRKLI
jgi:hypothetical protein